MFQFNKQIEDGRARYALAGHLDTYAAPALAKDLRDSLAGVRELTLDLEKLEYISSAGLRVLLGAQKAMDRQGKMKVLHANDAVMEVFELTGFAAFLDFD